MKPTIFQREPRNHAVKYRHNKVQERQRDQMWPSNFPTITRKVQGFFSGSGPTNYQKNHFESRMHPTGLLNTHTEPFYGAGHHQDHQRGPGSRPGPTHPSAPLRPEIGPKRLNEGTMGIYQLSNALSHFKNSALVDKKPRIPNSNFIENFELCEHTIYGGFNEFLGDITLEKQISAGSILDNLPPNFKIHFDEFDSSDEEESLAEEGSLGSLRSLHSSQNFQKIGGEGLGGSSASEFGANFRVRGFGNIGPGEAVGGLGELQSFNKFNNFNNLALNRLEREVVSAIPVNPPRQLSANSGRFREDVERVHPSVAAAQQPRQARNLQKIKNDSQDQKPKKLRKESTESEMEAAVDENEHLAYIEDHIRSKSDRLALEILKSVRGPLSNPVPLFSLKATKSNFKQVKNFIDNYRVFGSHLTESKTEQFDSVFNFASSLLVKTKYIPNGLAENTNQDKAQISKLRKAYLEMPADELYRQSHEEKESSSKLQSFLKIADLGDLEKIAGRMKGRIYSLCFDKYGNYVAQIFLERLPKFRQNFRSIYMKNLKEMMENQYSSRVLQKLISLNDSKFLRFSVGMFSKNFKLFLRDLSSVIFATKLINQASSEDSDFEFLVKVLEAKPKIILDEPHMMRLLVSAFSKFENQLLRRIFKPLKKYIWNMLNDKFGNYILQKVVEKDLRPYKSLIESLCIKHSQKLILKKYPRYILLKIIENDEFGKFSERFFYQLCFKEGQSYVHKKIMWKPETSCLLVLAMFRMKEAKLRKLFPRFIGLVLKDKENFKKEASQCKFTNQNQKNSKIQFFQKIQKFQKNKKFEKNQNFGKIENNRKNKNFSKFQIFNSKTPPDLFLDPFVWNYLIKLWSRSYDMRSE